MEWCHKIPFCTSYLYWVPNIQDIIPVLFMFCTLKLNNTLTSLNLDILITSRCFTDPWLLRWFIFFKLFLQLLSGIRSRYMPFVKPRNMWCINWMVFFFSLEVNKLPMPTCVIVIIFMYVKKLFSTYRSTLRLFRCLYLFCMFVLLNFSVVRSLNLVLNPFTSIEQPSISGRYKLT